MRQLGKPVSRRVENYGTTRRRSELHQSRQMLSREAETSSHWPERHLKVGRYRHITIKGICWNTRQKKTKLVKNCHLQLVKLFSFNVKKWCWPINNDFLKSSWVTLSTKWDGVAVSLYIIHNLYLCSKKDERNLWKKKLKRVWVRDWGQTALSYGVVIRRCHTALSNSVVKRRC